MRVDKDCKKRLELLSSTIGGYTVVNNDEAFNALFRKLCVSNVNDYNDYVGAFIYLFSQQDIDLPTVYYIFDLIKEKNQLVCDSSENQLENLKVLLTCIEMVATVDEKPEKPLEIYEYVFNNYKEDFSKDTIFCRESLLLPLYKGYYMCDNRQKAYKYALASAQITGSAYDAYQAYRFYNIHFNKVSDDLLEVMQKVSTLVSDECEFNDDFEGILLTNILLASYFSDILMDKDSAKRCYLRIVDLCDNYKEFPMTPRVLRRYESNIESVKKSALNGIKKIENKYI